MPLHDAYVACDTLYEIRQGPELLFQVDFQLPLICSMIGQPDTELTEEVRYSTVEFVFYGPDFWWKTSSDSGLQKVKQKDICALKPVLNLACPP